MSISNLNEICRLCLEPSDVLYRLDSDFCILVMESGASITIADALDYLAMDIKIAPEAIVPAIKEDGDDEDDGESKLENPEAKSELGDDPLMVEQALDDPTLPKSMCQECLEKLQTAYEFKFRCDENRTFLKNYLKECADSKLAEDRAIKEAAYAALDLDLDNLDSLPDKLVLKEKVIKEKKPRKQRDPAKPPISRRRRIPDKNVIIAENSQVESSAYVRKIITTPEQSPDQQGASKRKSKHVIIEDIFVGPKKSEGKAQIKPKIKDKDSKENETEVVPVEEPEKELPTEENEEKVVGKNDDEPIFEDDDDFEEPKPKRGKKAKK